MPLGHEYGMRKVWEEREKNVRKTREKCEKDVILFMFTHRKLMFNVLELMYTALELMFTGREHNFSRNKIKDS